MDDSDYIEPATKIDPQDASTMYRADLSETKREFYDRLELWNRLEWNGKWRDETQQRSKERRAILDALSSAVDLKAHQRERAKGILSDAPDHMEQGYAITLLTFCALALACKPDGRHWHPDRLDENNDPLFSAVLDRLGFSEREVRKCYKRLDASDEVKTP